MNKDDLICVLRTGSKRYCGNCKYAFHNIMEICVFCMADDDYSKWIWDGERK